MDFRQALTARQIYTHCDPGLLNFETTAELDPLTDPIGQERAIAAINFGIGMPQDGYNLFLLGPSGGGKHHLLRRVIEPIAKSMKNPVDWCYIYNFDNPQRPIAISLPQGTGITLRHDLKLFAENLFHAIQTAFKSEVYTTQEKHIDAEYRKRENAAFNKIEQDAHKNNVAFLRTESGFAFAPVKNKKIIEPHEFQRLPVAEQEEINNMIEKLQEQLEELLQNIPLWLQETRQDYKELTSKTARLAVSYLIDELKDKYKTQALLLDFFDRIEQDIIDNVNLFRRADIMEAGLNETLDSQQLPQLRHYQINLFIDHTATQGAPVIYADNPTQANLIGKTEYLSHMGTLITDFQLIRPGALHQANGGFLIIDAHKLLTQPYAWEALKRTLNSNDIVIESVYQSLGLNSTVSLEPDPIPLRTKVILVGERFVYYLLCEHDPEFGKLFKVAADLEDQVVRNNESSNQLSRLIAAQIKTSKLLPFDRTAVARIIEHSARIIEHANKLSLHMGEFTDLLCESNYWATQHNNACVTSTDVQTAIDQQNYRHGRVSERLREHVMEGSTLVDVAGSAIGQINGLSIVSYGNHLYGMPSRITATARPGDGKLIDIEHEADLGGEIHTKGVLILSHFMAARYATHKTFSVSASVGFEQSYGGVEGDSASAAELCAVLSAICKIPLKQNLAITGSINQHGVIQVIGGINEKIEGFYDICVEKGLSGDQGVVIPRNNVQHLMLKQEIQDAVEKKQFHVYSVEHIDEVLELFSGMPAGERNDENEFAEGTFNRAVEDALVEMAEQVHPPHEDDEDEDEEETEKKSEKSTDKDQPDKNNQDT